jgi:hypothetical protein
MVQPGWVIVSFLTKLFGTYGGAEHDIDAFRDCANDTEIIANLVLNADSGYNKHKIPAHPVDVRVEMWVQEVTTVSELTQDFEIGLSQPR